MGSMEGIYNMLRSMGGRRFRFVEHREGVEFQCEVCRNSGHNGYILEDDIGRITVGETCFHEYFLIHPQEVPDPSGESTGESACH